MRFLPVSPALPPLLPVSFTTTHAAAANTTFPWLVRFVFCYTSAFYPGVSRLPARGWDFLPVYYCLLYHSVLSTWFLHSVPCIYQCLGFSIPTWATTIVHAPIPAQTTTHCHPTAYHYLPTPSPFSTYHTYRTGTLPSFVPAILEQA